MTDVDVSRLDDDDDDDEPAVLLLFINGFLFDDADAVDDCDATAAAALPPLRDD